jgi:hypothetical protein
MDDRPTSPDVGAGADGDQADAAPPSEDASGDVTTSLDAPGDVSDAPTVPDAPAPPCPTGVLFCDGFEQGLGAWPQIEQTNGTIGLDMTHVHRGAYAVRAHMDALAPQGQGYNPAVTIDHTQAWPSHYWVRVFVYAPSPFPPTNAALLNLIQSTNNNAGLQLFLGPNTADVSMTTFDMPNNHTWGSMTASPLDQWVCLELDADAQSGAVNVAMNGADIGQLAMTGLTLPVPDITKLGLGFYDPNTQGPYDVWFDDIIVDGNPIGCAE